MHFDGIFIELTSVRDLSQETYILDVLEDADGSLD